MKSLKRMALFVSMKIQMNNSVYKIHPVYDFYAGDKNGNIINLVRKVPIIANKNNVGYMRVNVRKPGGKNKKTYSVHRFIWECSNGVIPNGLVIDHINDVKDDNRLINLHLLTKSENSKKAAKNRDYTDNVKNFHDTKCVKSIDIETGEETYFNSMYITSKNLGINIGMISKIIRNETYHKTGISKKDGKRYKFEFVKKEGMPDDYIKSANIRPKRISAEEKARRKADRLNKLFVCKCGGSYKHQYKNVHKRYCKSESNIDRIMEKIKIKEYAIKRSLNKIEEKHKLIQF